MHELDIMADTVNKVFSNQSIKFLGDLITAAELCEVILCFFSVVIYILKQVPIYFSCLGERCFTVKLQKCFVDFETWE